MIFPAMFGNLIDGSQNLVWHLAGEGETLQIIIEIRVIGLEECAVVNLKVGVKSVFFRNPESLRLFSGLS